MAQALVLALVTCVLLAGVVASVAELAGKGRQR